MSLPLYKEGGAHRTHHIEASTWLNHQHSRSFRKRRGLISTLLIAIFLVGGYFTIMTSVSIFEEARLDESMDAMDAAENSLEETGTWSNVLSVDDIQAISEGLEPSTHQAEQQQQQQPQKELTTAQSNPRPVFIHRAGFDGRVDPTCPVAYRITNSEEHADVIIHEILRGAGSRTANAENAWQHHALFSMESEANYGIVGNAKSQGYDITMTYDLTSDVPIPYTYSFMDWMRAPKPLAEKRTDALVAAFISNCAAHNNREQLLREMIESGGAGVHSYGACVNNRHTEDEPVTSGLDRWSQKTALIRTYKFTIAFENSNVDDYFTEKYYQALEGGSVPVVLGGANFAAEFMVRDKVTGHPGAIVVDSNETGAALMKRLEKIAADPAVYNKYLSWKTNGWQDQFQKVIDFQKRDDMCRLAMHVRGLVNTYKRPKDSPALHNK